MNYSSPEEGKMKDSETDKAVERWFIVFVVGVMFLWLFTAYFVASSRNADQNRDQHKATEKRDE